MGPLSIGSLHFEKILKKILTEKSKKYISLLESNVQRTNISEIRHFSSILEGIGDLLYKITNPPLVDLNTVMTYSGVIYFISSY